MDRTQQEAFGEAVERKNREAEARSREPGGRPPAEQDAPEVQESIVEQGRPQDVQSVRDKSSGKGKKTADKWNQ